MATQTDVSCGPPTGTFSGVTIHDSLYDSVILDINSPE